MEGLVSIIIPCYNHINYVEESILSVLGQSYSDIELIVIDDGSTDGSAELLERLSREYKFRLYIQENCGLAETLNKAIFGYAKGDFIQLLASDDVLHEDKISVQVSFLSTNPEFDFISGNYHEINSEGVVLKHWKRLDSEISFEDIFVHGVQVTPVTLFYRRSFWRDLGKFKPGVINEDGWLLLNALNMGKRLYHLNIDTALYRKHSSNTTRDRLRIYRASKELFDSFQDHPLYTKAIKKQYLFFLDNQINLI